MRLDNKVALVTGGASGIGKGIVELFAESGAAVVIFDLQGEKARAVADSLKDRHRVLAITGDVSRESDVRSAVAQTVEQFGALDILINNAGIEVGGTFADLTTEQWDLQLGVNLKGAFLMATEVARRMRDRGQGGSIINIESILSFRQAGHVAPYAASKAGLTQLTRTVALELARNGIRVNGIAPGYFATEINQGFFDTEPGQALIRRIPQRRVGQYEDLDGPLLLASDASRYMTGSTLVVDGGHLCSSL